MNSRIRFFSDECPFVLRDKTRIRKWILSVIKSENRTAGDINFIFCDDERLLSLNIAYLHHNTLTDIITFPSDEDKDVISGEIYISVDRVSENAAAFSRGFDDELSRVMVHGVLHLLGYKDKGKKERNEMRAKEDFYLEKR